MRDDGNERRRAAATGIACTMSPSAPRRTSRTRAGSPAMTDAADQISRGVALGVADDRRPSAVALHDGSLGNRVDGVIRAFAVDVWFQESQQTLDVRIGKHDDIV